MKNVVRAAAIAAFLFVAASAFAFNEPNGYGGVTWGTPVGQIASLEYKGTMKDNPELLLYSRKNEDLTYGRARLSGVEYGFVGGKLSQVTLRVNSLLQYLLMKEEAFRLFGTGSEIDERSERFVWEGPTTRIRLVSAFDMS